MNVAAGFVALLNWEPFVLGPLTTDHAPVPTDGEFPDSAALPVLHIVCVEPFVAVVGFWLNFTSISSKDAVHGAFEIVQRKVYVVPAIPLKLVVGLVASANVPPVPLSTVHNPVPIDGALPASVTLVSPHVENPV